MPVIPNESMTRHTHPFVFACDKPICFWRLAFKTKAEANAEAIIHTNTDHCPYIGGKSSYFMDIKDDLGRPYTKPGQGKSMGEKLWDLLDLATDAMMTEPDEYKKGYARGLAVTLQLMMFNFYPSSDAVVIEAVRRHKQRKGDVQFEFTPGYNYNPIPSDHPRYREAAKRTTAGGASGASGTASPATGGTAKRAPRVAPVVEPHLDQEAIDNIRGMLAVGVKHADLASTYSTTVEHIKRVSS